MATGNVLSPADHAATVARLQRLLPDTPRQWGTMTPAQMLVHCADQIRVTIGEKPMTTKVPGFLKPLARWLLVDLLSTFPKNMKTLRELDPARDMTRPTNFALDREQLLALIDPARYAKRPYFDHPAFGRLTREQFGTIVWKHLDHHLRQFGV